MIVCVCVCFWHDIYSYYYLLTDFLELVRRKVEVFIIAFFSIIVKCYRFGSIFQMEYVVQKCII